MLGGEDVDGRALPGRRRSRTAAERAQLGERARELRAEGLTWAAVAARLGVAESTAQAFAAGVSSPRVMTARR